MIGIDLIKNHKANAADAAIAIAAALAVLEPCSTGLGGDMFCLYYDAKSKSVSCINGSGKSPAALSFDTVYDQCGGGGVESSLSSMSSKYANSALAVTVPGAARGWEDLYNKYGSKNLTFAELLEPAAQLAEEGFPVAPIAAHFWESDFASITRWYHTTTTLSTSDTTTEQPQRYPLTTAENKPPKAGDIVTNIDMAKVLRELGSKGATEGFYNNWIGQSIVSVIQKHGGCMTMADLQSHTTSIFPEPVQVQYRDVQLWQVPPNGQGVAGLIALAGLQELENDNVIPKLSPSSMGSVEQYHVLIEMMRLGFADARAHVADEDHMKVSCRDYLLDPVRIGERAKKLFNPNQATIHGIPDASSCTVSFQVVDREGNAISMVNSNYTGFGSGIVPEGCGFPLQNRGCGLTLSSREHPNCVGPSKRPYHTIIPGMVTYADTNELYATISNMGGNMQPQGHFQLLVNMVAGEMNPQAAIEAPRFCIADGTQQGIVSIETGVPDTVIHDITERMGHVVKSNVTGFDRNVFGRAQIIQRNRTTGALWAGSDGRADGCAIGF
jgi:gamma-glutamyltranspeptidase / glutathione hydrolase